jgi:glycosyltransferase involved in cell wall biosynthesis
LQTPAVQVTERPRGLGPAAPVGQPHPVGDVVALPVVGLDPLDAELKIGVPTLPSLVEALAEGRYDLVHVCSPGPAGIGAWLLARVLELPVVGSYHTELVAYAGLRSGLPHLEALAATALGAFYAACDMVLSPTPASDGRLAELGIAPERIGRWDRGVDLERFDPALRREGAFPGRVNVLYAGRLTAEKGVGLLADAFLAARELDPGLHLVLAGGGAEEGELRERLGEAATFLGWLGGQELARAYASADAFLFASRTDTFGQVILEAQASGLPVVAVNEGGPASLVTDGETGLLAPADPDVLAERLLTLVHTPLLRERLRKTALAVVRERTWEASLERLASGYRSALLRAPASGEARSVA